MPISLSVKKKTGARSHVESCVTQTKFKTHKQVGNTPQRKTQVKPKVLVTQFIINRIYFNWYEWYTILGALHKEEVLTLKHRNLVVEGRDLGSRKTY